MKSKGPTQRPARSCDNRWHGAATNKAPILTPGDPQMRTTPAAIALVLAACAGCAGMTPQQRELALVSSYQNVGEMAINAVEHDIITPEEAEAIEGILAVAERDIRRATQDRRAAEQLDLPPPPTWERILAAVEDALLEAGRILEGRE